MGSLVNFWRAKPKRGVDLFIKPKNCRLASRKSFHCVMSDVGKFDWKVELPTNDILHLQCVCVGRWGGGGGIAVAYTSVSPMLGRMST